MQDKLDELNYIYKMIGDYGFCTVQELLHKYNKQKEVIDILSTRLEYFLIGNSKYQSSQEEFIKLLDVLKEV